MELIYQEQKEVEPVYEMYQKIFEDALRLSFEKVWISEQEKKHTH